MENKGLDLALAYLNAFPAEAAHLLEQQPVEEAAKFLDGIPHTTCATVLSRMLPQHVASLCGYMNPENCAAFLTRMEIAQVAAILRCAKPQSQGAIYKLLPDRVKLACQVLLGYSQYTVGAWMAPNVSALPIDCSAEEALSRIKADENFFDLDNIHVVAREGILLGSLSCRKLLSAVGQTKISTIMDSNLRTVQGRSTVEAAINHTGWRSRDAMPVVNRKGQFIGVIRRVDLRRAIERGNSLANTPRQEGIFFQLIGIYGRCLIAMVNTFGYPERPIKA